MGPMHMIFVFLGSLIRRVCAYFMLGNSMQASCFKRSSRAAIPMMQAADHWGRNHLATVRRLNIACNRRVAIQRQVRAGVMIILKVTAQNSAKMFLIQHDDMIQTLTTYRSDQSFDVRILPGRSRSRNDFLDANVPDSLTEELSVDRISITDQESRCCFFRQCFDDLLGSPLGCRVRRDVEVRDEASIMSKYNETEQDAKRRSRNSEEIDSYNILKMIIQESSPCLRRRLAMADLVLVNRCLRRLVAKQSEFRLDSWSSPERILQRHTPNQLADLRVNLWPTGLPGP